MTIDYRYYTVPCLATVGTSVVCELPLTGAYLDKQLSGAGNLTAGFRLGTKRYNDGHLIGGTMPGFYQIVCLRNNEFIWAGPIWTRTYQASSKTFTITAQTWESAFDRILLETDMVFSAIDQTTIFQNWLAGWQGQYGGSGRSQFNIAYGAPTPSTTGVTRTFTVLAAEDRMVGDVLSNLSDTDTGLSWSINYASGTGDAPSKTCQLYHNDPPKFVASTDISVSVDYPGTIANYWFTENSSQGAIRWVAHGSDSLRSAADGVPPGTASQWPLWAAVKNYSDIEDVNILAARAAQLARNGVMPIARPTFDLNAKANFAGWNSIGKTYTAQVIDPRFPSGATITARMTGWALRPEQSDQPESVTVSFEGD